MEFDSDQLPAFLQQIARDESRELEQLRADHERESRAARSEVRRTSRLLHHRMAEQARIRIESDYARKLSRARNEFRRRRWQVLEQLRERAGAAVLSRLLDRWREPASQRSWCRYWLDVCEGLDQHAAVEARVSSDLHSAVVEFVRHRVVDMHGDSRVFVDPELDPGLVVIRGQLSLDGRLRTQLGPLLDEIERELARWVHGSGEADGESR